MLTQRIHLIQISFTLINTQITFIWIPGHIKSHSSKTSYHSHKNIWQLSSACLWLQKSLPISHTLIVEYFLKKSTSQKTFPHRAIPTHWSSTIENSRREKIILSPLQMDDACIIHSLRLNHVVFNPSSCVLSQEEIPRLHYFFSCSQLFPPFFAQCSFHNFHTLTYFLHILFLFNRRTENHNSWASSAFIIKRFNLSHVFPPIIILLLGWLTILNSILSFFLLTIVLISQDPQIGISPLHSPYNIHLSFLKDSDNPGLLKMLIW